MQRLKQHCPLGNGAGLQQVFQMGNVTNWISVSRFDCDAPCSVINQRLNRRAPAQSCSLPIPSAAPELSAR